MHRPLVQKFLVDRASFELVSTTRSVHSGEVLNKKSTRNEFSELAAATLREIDQR